MPTYLHLASDENEDARFYHPITNPISEEVGDEFDYDDHYYFQIPEKGLVDFKNKNLTKGIYIIREKYYNELNEFWTVVMYKKKD
jgi:hypothetical protein